MNKFIGYGDIENTYRKEWLERVKMYGYGSPDIVYACYRKIDGSNFQITVDSFKDVLFGKRTAYITDDFSNYEEVMDRYDMKSKILNIRNDIENNMFSDKNLISWVENHPKFTFTLFGELFGGSYRHKDVDRNPKAAKIMGRICYSPNNEFIAFDARVVDETDVKGERPNSRYIINLDTLREICAKYDIPYQIEEFRGTLNECLNFKIDNINDDTGVRLFGLPPIENNIIEGVVIKPIEAIRIGFNRVIFKNKNEEFKEKIKHPPKKTANIVLKNERENKWFQILKEYMNENRVMSAVSKVGSSNFGDIIKEANLDALNDFRKDHPELSSDENQFEKYDFDFSNVTKAFNRYSAPIVREVYLKLNNY